MLINYPTQTLLKTTSRGEAVEAGCLPSDLQISLLVVTRLIFSSVVSGKLMNSFQVLGALPRKFLFPLELPSKRVKGYEGITCTVVPPRCFHLQRPRIARAAQVLALSAGYSDRLEQGQRQFLPPRRSHISYNQTALNPIVTTRVCVCVYVYPQ